MIRLTWIIFCLSFAIFTWIRDDAGQMFPGDRIISVLCFIGAFARR